MATETSNIDDVLATAHLPAEQQIHPAPPESVDEPEDAPEVDIEPEAPEEPEPEAEAPEADDVDEYGNERPKQESKSYTEDEVNEKINKAVRERLARIKTEAPQAPPPTQVAGQEFEYNEESSQSWQQQLESFVEQTVSKMTNKQQQAQQQAQQAQEQAEFEEKFHNGMSKFRDFREVVGAQPITEAMTVAVQDMKDPAAFLYAASKRHADELARISKLTTGAAQIRAMGNLEERMRKAKAATKAPRPLSSTRDDASMSLNTNEKPLTIEQQIAASDSKRLKTMRARYSR